MEDMIKRKLKFAGHVMRGSSGLSYLQISEGRLEGKRKVGGAKRTWMNDVTEWAKSKTYGEIKRMAEKKEKWRLMVSTFVYEVDK